MDSSESGLHDGNGPAVKSLQANDDLPMTTPAVHHSALQGFSQASERYAKGRPDYPDELLGWLQQDVGATVGARVVDIGAGTGKFTQLLVRTGADVTAVEPVREMGARLSAILAQVRVLEGTAESLPLGSGSADALICAQAFHWFANERALQEMHRVLRPGGKLGLVWNVRDESVDWVAAVTRIITPYEGDTPRFHTGEWRRPFAHFSGFAPLQCTVFGQRHRGTFEDVVINRTLSVSFIAALDDGTRQDIESELRALPQTYPALRAETVEFPYATQAWITESQSPT